MNVKLDNLKCITWTFTYYYIQKKEQYLKLLICQTPLNKQSVLHSRQLLEYPVLVDLVGAVLDVDGEVALGMGEDDAADALEQE